MILVIMIRVKYTLLLGYLLEKCLEHKEKHSIFLLFPKNTSCDSFKTKDLSQSQKGPVDFESECDFLIPSTTRGHCYCQTEEQYNCFNI